MTNKENVTPIKPPKPIWKLRYTVERGEYTTDDILTENQTLSDDLVVVLLKDNPETGLPMMQTQVYEDPRKPNYSRQVQALMSIANNLMQDQRVPAWQRKLGERVVGMLRKDGQRAAQGKAGGVVK